MTRCSGCGEPLAKAGEACPVCNTLDLPDTPIFNAAAAPVSPAQSDEDKRQDDGLLSTGPVLGAGSSPKGKSETVRIAKPVLPAKQGEKAQENADMPVLQSGDSDYQKRFDEEAEIFGSEAYNIKRIEELRDRGVPIVLFMGMRTTGKTWLIQRMKHMLYRQFDCHPAVKLTDRAIESDAISSADETEQRQKYLGRSKLTKAELERRAAGDSGRTSAMIFHEFEPINPGEGHEFVLVDVPGEDFRLLADGNFSAIRSLACALKYAGTVIVALPSDITLLASRVNASEFDDAEGIDTVRADHEFVQKLTGSLADMSKMRSILLTKNVSVQWKPEDAPPDAYDREITAEKLRAHTWKNGRQPFGGEDGMRCPVYIALTKADRFFSAAEKLPDLKRAPKDLFQKLDAANGKLRDAADGPLFARLFQSSPLKKKNLLETPGWLSDAFKVLAGDRIHVAPISNPPEMLLQANDGLFNRLNANFPMSRIDLVAAFYGHTGNTLCLADLGDYPDVGVQQMTDWLAKVHDQGLTADHGWARSAFSRIYRTDDQGVGPAGGARKKVHNWRLRFAPPKMLAAMFRKEFHPLQMLPALATAFFTVIALFLTNNWLDPKDKVTQSALYEALVEEGAEVPALGALPALPDSAQRLLREGKISQPYAKALWDPVAGLTSWSTKSGAYIVAPPKPMPEEIAPPAAPTAGKKDSSSAKRIREAETEIAKIRPDQLKWQSQYFCGLEGWGDYRNIIRKAVINGYGDCSIVTKLAARSPLVNATQQWFGWAVGLLAGVMALALLWAIAAAAGFYAVWFHKTRKAYGWLYHSGVATAQRDEPATQEAQ